MTLAVKRSDFLIILCSVCELVEVLILLQAINKPQVRFAILFHRPSLLKQILFGVFSLQYNESVDWNEQFFFNFSSM